MGAELFDRQGRVLDASVISDVLLAPTFPSWSPVFMVERPTSPLVVTASRFAIIGNGATLSFAPGAGVLVDRLVVRREHRVALLVSDFLAVAGARDRVLLHWAQAMQLLRGAGPCGSQPRHHTAA
jgi:hypothetical protein